MRDLETEISQRVEFIRKQISNARADGIVYGNSGGKDSALVGILCKKACDNTIGLIMPCTSKRNYDSDMNDAIALAKQFEIETYKIDLTETAETIKRALNASVNITETAQANIAPRLRMTSLYAVAASDNRLVAGTGNRSEGYMGYFTKWGDGACDFNVIADLTVHEIYDLLRYFKAPEQIINKAPSAGLFDGQTDEKEMGVTYKMIDEYLINGTCDHESAKIIQKYHTATEHKRNLPAVYSRESIS